MRLAVTPPMLADYRDALSPLATRGFEVEINRGPYPLPEPDLCAFIGHAQAVICGLETMSANVMDKCPRLRIIARNGVGCDNVDLAAATRRGIVVTAPFGANSTSVAELTIALIICLLRQVIPRHNRLQTGVWERLEGREASGKTLGIVGLGRIGKRVALRAQALEMHVIANDILPDHAFAHKHGIAFVSFDEIMRYSDVVTLHVPLTPLTRGMINAHSLAAMKRGAYLINTARAGVVDPVALGAALDSGHIAGAALDVHEAEGPGGFVHPALVGRPNVITTPHLGGFTVEALQRTTALAVESIIDAREGRKPAGLVNEEVWQRRRGYEDQED